MVVGQFVQSACCASPADQGLSEQQVAPIMMWGVPFERKKYEYAQDLLCMVHSICLLAVAPLD